MPEQTHVMNLNGTGTTKTHSVLHRNES